MSRIYDSILELIGNTPLVAFHKTETYFQTVGNIIGKLEFFNPGFSVKARIAKNMIENAEKSGKLGPDSTIIEGTSGNTGIGLAMVAAVKGYRSIIAMHILASAMRKFCWGFAMPRLRTARMRLFGPLRMLCGT